MSALPNPEQDLRLSVALATHAEKTQLLLRALLNGPGRGLFQTKPRLSAQCLIADYDYAAARQELQQFRAQYQRPAIVLALRNPGLPGTVWVPKPIEFDALSAAALSVRLLMQPATLHSSPPPDEVSWAPSASRPPENGRELAGPFKMGAPPDWTAKIGWMALGVLGIAALTSWLGWHPAVSGWRAPVNLAPDPSLAQRELRRAVLESLELPSRPSPAEYQRVEALQREYLASAQLSSQLPTLQSIAQATDLPHNSKHALPVALLAFGQASDPQERRESAVDAALGLVPTAASHATFGRQTAP